MSKTWTLPSWWRCRDGYKLPHCTRHPTYDAIHQPRGMNCVYCWRMYWLAESLKRERAKVAA